MKKHSHWLLAMLLTCSALLCIACTTKSSVVKTPASKTLVTLPVLKTTTAAARGPLTLKKGDHICLVGNALGERMQHQNHWETLLHQQFPDHQLTVRNLCFPGDEVDNRQRSKNFRDPNSHLSHSKANVILFFFGYNESFQGAAGAKKYQSDLTKLVIETGQKKYDGKNPPRIVLVSPIAFENTGDPNLPDGKEHNKRLKMYTEIMRIVSITREVGFIDMFTPTQKLFAAEKNRLTLNGFHLNSEGYQKLAPLMNEQLFGVKKHPKQNKTLRKEVAGKNFHWWHRYRIVNGFSIYGDRGLAGTTPRVDGKGVVNNRQVMEHERHILDQMCEIRDRRIWAIAQGKKVSAKIDDSKTDPFIEVKTNLNIKKQKNKLGPLDYVSAEEQLKHFKLPPGYEINLFASEKEFPALANPVSLNFDNKGRLWVSTMPSYPHWKPKTKMNDQLLIFEDNDNDGKADKCKVFADGLYVPTGFEIGRGGVYVAQQPDVLFLKDTNGDDKADVRIRQIIGLGSADTHHGISAFEWGPGGGLYFEEGTFKRSQVEGRRGLHRLNDSGVWRYDPKTEKTEVHASVGFANPWGHVFDKWGQNFIADASPGQNFWATPISGNVPFPAKHPGGAWGPKLQRIKGALRKKAKHKYPLLVKKRMRPSAGSEIISSRHFPPEAQGRYLNCNVIGDLAILQYTLTEDVDSDGKPTSGFTGKELSPPLVQCTHGNFRPIDIQFGPDGALYIVDWHNAIIGHLQHNLRDPNRDHKHGRIWRVTYKGRPLVKPAKISGESIPHLLNLLKEPEDRTRYRTRRELAERDSDKVYAAVQKWVKGLDAKDKNHGHNLLEALWVCQTHNKINIPLLEQLLKSKDHKIRAAVTRVACYWREELPKIMDYLKTSISDKHPRVRLEAVRACSFIHTVEALKLSLKVLNLPTDEYLDYTFEETQYTLQYMLELKKKQAKAAAEFSKKVKPAAKETALKKK